MRGNGLLWTGLALGVGGYVYWRSRSNRPTVSSAFEPRSDGHWSPAMRIAAGAVGGGLILYGSRGPGRLSRVAAAAGTGMLMRSLRDEPIRELADIVKPRMLLGA